MKNYNEIVHRIEVLEGVIEEIYNSLNEVAVSLETEAAAEKVIIRLRNQIEGLRWTLNA